MANKITKREVIGMMMNEEAIKSNETFMGYLTHELELLDKKSSSKKPTKNQEANEGLKDVIIEVLSEATEPLTISAMQTVNEALGELSNQKVSALVRQLVANGDVVRVPDKKVTKFSLA